MEDVLQICNLAVTSRAQILDGGIKKFRKSNIHEDIKVGFIQKVQSCSPLDFPKLAICVDDAIALSTLVTPIHSLSIGQSSPQRLTE
jgi:hypothetical protein